MAGFPVVACSNARSEARPASKTWADERTVAKGLRACCQESLLRASAISFWRARICHNPTTAWKRPTVLARTAGSEILSSAAATARKRAMEALFRA